MGYRVLIIEAPEGEDLSSNLAAFDNYRDSQKIESADYALILYPQDRVFERFLEQGLDSSSAEITACSEAVKKGFAERASQLAVYLSPGRVLTVEGGNCYSCGWLFNPRGELILEQKQLFLSREERHSGLQRGVELKLAATEYGRIGFLLHTDCWYPEVGRFLALEGADLILAVNHPAAGSYWKQLSGVWSQVQQNQFFALEAAGGGINLIHGICEITPYHTGLIAPVGNQGDALSHHPDRYLKLLADLEKKKSGLKSISGVIDLEKRAQSRQNYDLLKLLNSSLYQKSGLENLLTGRREGQQ